ncbi:hypothetical protein [Kitasatospora sp. NPDC056181]|uniref:hypothetical protein n=1 Tax=Kitasatospora sp. NPDC056181 TaxID=3345737 RepID=UPI0035D707A7
MLDLPGLGGDVGSVLELREEAGPDRLECQGYVEARAAKDLGPLVLPGAVRLGCPVRSGYRYLGEVRAA